MAALSVGYVAWHGHHAVAFAKGDDSGDDNGDDSDDSGDDKADDKGDSDDSDDANDEDAKNQPPVTAGGLFTLKTYPTNANLRPLTMTQNIAEVKLGLGTDLSSKGAFDTFGFSLEGKYGVTDNFTLLGGFTSAYNTTQFSAYFGFEGSLIYDLLDIRIAADLGRTAIPRYSAYCKPVTGSPTPPCNADATAVFLPNGDYGKGSPQFSVDIGFPFRYAIKPQIAIVALSTLMSIDFNRANKAYAVLTPLDPAPVDQTMEPAFSVDPVGNGPKPDFNPSIGVALNPIAQINVLLFAQFRVPDFDFDAGVFQVPLTGRVQVSPNQKIDFGLEFSLLNVLPPEGQSAIDNRFLSIFLAYRAGK